MAKKLLATGYRIDINENAVYLDHNILHQRLLLITDVTLNRIIYNFADSASGLVSINYDADTDETKIVFVQSLSLLEVSEDDTLQVLIENEAVEIRPEDPFLDPVSKLRVSNPENLIDTDFEYGLQSTKWETIKLVNNVPSFYSKATAQTFDIVSVQATEFSNSVVVKANEHGLTLGTPFELSGLTDSQYEGGYIVSSVPDINTFTFDIPFSSISTQELSTVYTNILTGAFYFGSQISVLDITTDGLPNSTIKVKTRFLHGFSVDTPFYFLNSVAVFRQDIPYSDISFPDTIVNEKQVDFDTIGENESDWRNKAITPYEFIPLVGTTYFDEAARGGTGRHDNKEHDWFYARMSPVASVVVNNGGAGYNYPPHVYAQGGVWGTDRRSGGTGFWPGHYTTNEIGVYNRDVAHQLAVMPSSRTDSYANTVLINTSSFIGLEWNGEPGQPQSNNWYGQRGIEVEIHRQDNQDPFSWTYGTQQVIMPWEDCLTATDRSTYGWTNSVTDPNSDGYSPIAVGSNCTLEGVGGGSIASNESTAILTVNQSNIDGELAVGQEISVFETSNNADLLRRGFFIKEIGTADGNGDIAVTIQMPPVHPGYSGSISCYFLAQMWDTIDSTIYIKNHGLKDGDAVFLWSDWTVGTGDYWRARTDNTNSVNVDNNAGEQRRTFYAVRVDENRFKISYWRMASMQGRSMDLYDIGRPNVISGVAQLPRYMFLKAKPLYIRGRAYNDRRYAYLYPTFEDAVNKTNQITFEDFANSGGTGNLGYRFWITTATARLDATIQNNQVTDISVTESGDHYYQHQEWSAYPYIAPRRITKGLAYSHVSGTNTLTLKTGNEAYPLLVGMRVENHPGDSGIPANCVITRVEAPDDDGFYQVVLSGNLTADMPHGDQIHFLDNVSTNAQAQTLLLGGSLYIPDHGLEFGDYIKFEHPPGASDGTLGNSTHGWRDYTTYYAIPISEDRFSLGKDSNSLDPNNIGRFTVRDNTIKPSYNTDHFTTRNGYRYAYSKVIRIESASGTEYRFNQRVDRAPWNLSVGDVVLQTSDWNGDSYWTGMAASRRTNRQDSWYDSRYSYPLYIKSISADGRGVELSTSPNGSSLSVGSQQAGRVFLKPVSLIPEANSIYIPDHGFETDDYVIYTADGIEISGLNAENGQNGYLIDKVSDSRFKLKNRANSVILDLYDDGNQTHTFKNEQYDNFGNTIFRESHGFAPSDRITYDPNNNPIIDGLVSNDEYTLRKVSDDRFRLSEAATAQDLDINRVYKVANATTIRFEFTKNHGYEIGTTIIIRDNDNQELNTFWVVSSIPTSPTFAGQPSAVICNLTPFQNPALAYDQRKAPGETYGVAYEYINFEPVASTNTIVEPAQAGDLFTTVKAFDSQISNKTARSDGGGIINEQITVKSDIIPLGSKVEQTQGTNIVTARIRFPQADISTISRESNVVTVVTSEEHGYDDQQTVVIDNVDTSSFNTDSPVTITVVDSTTFTFAQTDVDEEDTAGNGEVTMALTQAQADKFSSNNINWDYTYTNDSYDTFRHPNTFTDTRYYARYNGKPLSTDIADGDFPSRTSGVAADAGSDKIWFTANYGQIPDITKQTSAPIYQGQFVIPLNNVDGISPGMYVHGADISNDQTYIESVDVENSRIFLTKPLTGNGPVNQQVNIKPITVGQEVRDDPQFTQVTGVASAVGSNEIETLSHNAKIAANLYPYATTALTPTDGNSDTDTNTFTLSTLSNIYNFNRVVQESWQSSDPYISSASYQSGSTDWGNVRSFNSVQNANPADDDIKPGADTITIPDHPWETGDAVRYNANGGVAPSGLTSGNVYYIISIDGDTIQLAASEADATDPTPVPVNIVDVGSGNGHYLFGNVYFGASITSNTATYYTGTILVGMGLSCLTSNATGVIPLGARVAQVRDLGAGVSQTYYRHVVKISTLDDSLVTGIMGGVDANGTESRMQLRAGTYSNGTTFYTDDVTGLAAGMVPAEWHNGDGTIVNGTIITSVDAVNNTFTVNNAPDPAIRGVRMIAATGVADTSVPTRIYTDNLTGLEVGMPIAQRSINTGRASANNTTHILTDGRPFRGRMFAPTTDTNTPYYVTNIDVAGGFFDINKNPVNDNGTNFLGELIAGAWTTTNSTRYLYVSNSVGQQLARNHTLNLLPVESDEQGALGSGYTFVNTTVGTPGNAPYRIYLNQNVGTYLRGIGIGFGARSINTEIYLPDASNINTGMELTLTGGTGSLQGAVTVTAVDPDNAYSDSSNGLGGDYISVTTDDASGDPFATDLIDAGIDFELDNAITVGQYVFSDVRSFPSNATVTAVDTNTREITISQTHGGIPSGTLIEFSPFSSTTYVSIPSTSSDNTITFSEPHGGIQGGVAVSYRKLPRGTRVSKMLDYYSSWWLIELAPPQPFVVPVSQTTSRSANGGQMSTPLRFIGENLNLASSHSFDSFGTHIFTRSSNADGVYEVIDTQPTEFTVGSTSFIPKNTKTFSNLDVDITNNWIKINNHKFRDGTALIYKPGSQDLIGIEYPYQTEIVETVDPETGDLTLTDEPIIDNEVGSPTEGLPLPQINPATGQPYPAFLEEDETYYTVLIDPSYFYLATSFDEARSENPRIIELRTNTNGAQAFDTFSLQGFTKGEGQLSLTDETSIVTGLGTKFQTNFKGGDVLRFYTQGNPGKIFKFIIQAVKSDESLKLTETVEPDRSLVLTLNNPVTLNAGDQISQTISAEEIATGYVTYDVSSATEIDLYDVGGADFIIGTNLEKIDEDATTTSLLSQPTAIVNPFNFTPFARQSYNTNQGVTTQGDQTIRMSLDAQGVTVEDIKPGYIISDPIFQYFEEDTRVISVNEQTGYITIDKLLKRTLPARTEITFQPTFEYFIETNLYVKSNAITSHKPFDGGVSMTTGLNPDSVISRQTRKYFRYQSGKGIQCSMAINFNPPTDCELLTSSENVATIRVDRPHGFKPGGENRIRVTEAQVNSGHNGYNGTFYVDTVIDDYNFTYIFEDTATIGKVTSGSNVINNVAKFDGIEVGKLIKSGTFDGISVDTNTVVEDFNEIQQTITLSKPLTGSSSTQSWESIDRVNNTLTVFTEGTREVAENRATLQFFTETVTFDIGSEVTQTQSDSTVATGVIIEVSENSITLNEISGDGTFSTGLPISVDGQVLNNFVPDDVTLDTVNVDQTFGSEHNLEVGQWVSIANASDSNLNFAAGEIISVTPTYFQVYSVGLDGDEDYTGTAEITVLNTLSQYRQNGSSTAYGFPKYNLKEWKDASIRAGLFDSQNGMFFEFDGKNLNCCRRSSVQQLSGKAIATYRSSLLRGVDTRYSTQLSPGDSIIIRGMTYKVIGIESDTALHIQPEYRGQSLTDIIVTKVVDVKIPQYEWNLDVADGTGRSGYVLDINKIQMVYIDYSWYGAGKIRFGFKNQLGEVVYFHEFVHNNRLVEAYMRSGNIPARYEVETYKEPTFSPALFHWGTSVIMDGTFDADEAYLFTADSNIITLTNGGKLEVSVPTNSTYQNFRLRKGNNYIWVNINDVSSLVKGAVIQVKGDTRGSFIPTNTTIEGVDLSQSLKISSITCVKVYISNKVRNSIWWLSTTVYEIGGGATAVSIDAQLSPIPLVSIRLSPSVDNGLSGGLGFRDVINRMQLTLNSCGVLLSHESEVKLYLNADLSDSDFINNDSPSLSQIHTHKPGETFLNGIQLFSFRANGGQKDPDTGKRTLSETSENLGELVTLGNSILGGDEVFPNGPDILTIAVKPIDTSTISGTEPFQGSARITWSESQA